MSKSLLIVGAGSFATEVEEMARLLGYEDIAFLDDCIENACCTPVVGKLCDMDKLRDKYDEAIVAFGKNQIRIDCTEKLIGCGYKIPVLIHPTAYVSPDASLEAGCIVRAYAVVGRYVELKRACIVNACACIDHHCIIGEGTHILIGGVVRNKVTLPPLTWVSANEVVE